MDASPEVAVFVIRDQDDSVLLLQRALADGGYWHVVAGRIEEGESPEEAAARELQEETGLIADVVLLGDVTEYASAETLMPSDAETGVAVTVSCFVAHTPRAWEPSLNEEHDCHLWCQGRQAANSLRWPGTAEALRSLLDQRT